MRFSHSIAIVAIISMATGAYAQQDGKLRRSVEVAKGDLDESLNSNGVVILNTNSNNSSAVASQEQTSDQAQSATSASRAVAQPTTVVEATALSESKAEILRKQRIEAEVNTEQKIVEKLEDARLQEERARAERLFGNKFDAPAQQQQQQQIVAPVIIEEVKPAHLPAHVPPTQVTIQKIEINQPVQEIENDVVVESVHKHKPIVEEAQPDKPRYFVGGQLGNANYDANNVKSNYGLGFTIGTLIENRWALEFGYFYSNHYIDTYWIDPIYSKLDQNDFSLTAKYYILPDKLKPYVGASATYISREYTERLKYGEIWRYNDHSSSESTQAVNMGLLGGVDFLVGNNFLLGAGFEYSFNVMNNNPIDWGNAYGVPSNAKDLEEISYYTLKVGAKYTF